MSDIAAVNSCNSFMGWQILKQLCNSLTERNKLTLLRESTPVRKWMESHHTLCYVMNKWSSFTIYIKNRCRSCWVIPVTAPWVGKYLNSFVIVLHGEGSWHSVENLLQWGNECILIIHYAMSLMELFDNLHQEHVFRQL